MIQFFENFNDMSADAFLAVWNLVALVFPFLFTVCFCAFFIIGGIGLLIGWIKERKSIKLHK